MLVSETKSPALRDWLEDFVERASQDDVVDRFVTKVDEAIMAQTPLLAGDPSLVQELHKSTRAHWRSFVALLGDDYRLVLPSQAVDLALSLARRGHDLVVLLKIYRVGQQSTFEFFNEFIESGTEGAPPRDELLVFMYGRAGHWIDDAIETLIETYVAERHRLQEGAAARRAEQIEKLLGDSPPAEDLSGSLGHALSQWQTAYVVWAAHAESLTSDAMTDVAGTVAEALGAPAPLSTAAGIRELWCWAATPSRPDLGGLAGLEPAALGGLHVAVGLPGKGVSGFRTSHAEARAAQRLTLSAVSASPVVRYDDVELLCLVADRGDAMRRMVAREIGPLAGADKNLALVRETVLAYLTTLNVEATADRLFVHKNTVRYRIAKAEELLGHPLSERSTQVELALRWVSLFGSPGDPD
jgi:hypothetical protein